MTCSICIQQKKNNASTGGTDNFRTSTPECHVECTDHINSIKEVAM